MALGGILARFERSRSSLQGSPENADAARRAQPDKMRTLNSSTFTREDSKRVTGERYGSNSQVQVPARVVVQPIRVTESV